MKLLIPLDKELGAFFVAEKLPLFSVNFSVFQKLGNKMATSMATSL
jgi:hypothetical protein